MEAGKHGFDGLNLDQTHYKLRARACRPISTRCVALRFEVADGMRRRWWVLAVLGQPVEAGLFWAGRFGAESAVVRLQRGG